MASKKSAVRPDFFSRLPTFKKEEELTKKGVSDEERFIYGMSETYGWPLFTKKKEELLRDLDVYQDAAISSGATREEIGENAIIISMVRGIINRLWNVVGDCKEACEQGTGGK